VVLSLSRKLINVRFGHRGRERKYLVFWICLTDSWVPSEVLILLVTDILLQHNLLCFVNAVDIVLSEVLKTLLAKGYNQVSQLSALVRQFQFLSS
jgi:hypothetical protein